MAVDVGLTAEAVAAASLLWKVSRHLLELALKKAEGAAVDSAKARLGQAIKKLFRLKGEEKKALEKGFAEARKKFLSLPGPRLEQMEWLELLFDGKSRASEEFAEAAVQVYLFKAEADLSWRYQQVVTFAGAEMPAWEEFEPVMAKFFDLLREELRRSSDHYREIFYSLAAGALAKTVEKGRRGPAVRVIPTAPKLGRKEAEAARERYRAQLAERCQRLKFLGILTRGEERPIPLDKIFVDLRVRREAERRRMPEVERMKRAEERAEERIPLRQEREVTYPPVLVQQAMRKHPRLVLTGAPGSGKSTLTRYLALIFARGQAAERLDIPEERFPLLIPLRDYLAERARHSDGFSFLDYLYCNAEEILCLDLPQGFFEHYLNRGECIVLFDGLDEVTDLSERMAVRDAVRSFANAFPENRYLVTSRPAGYEEAPLPRDGYPHFDILDFTDEEIDEFVTKWYELRELSEREAKDKRESLLKAIERSPGVKRLAVNPLLLTIIALIHRQEAELPNQRVILYDKCTEVLLYSWERAKGLKWGIGPEEMKRRLEHIAFWMYERGKVSAERAVTVEREELEWELARFLRKCLPDPTKAADEARRFLDLVRERAGLLMELGRGLYSFVHLTFQEYFAAMDVYWHCQDEMSLDVVQEVVLGHLHEPAWREVSLLAISKLKPKPATKMVREILEAGSDYEDVLHRDLFFAARCLADDVEVDWGLSQEILGQLVEIFRTTDLEQLQNDTLEALTALRGSRYASPAADLLLPLACDKGFSGSRWWSLIRALGQFGPTNNVDIVNLLEQAHGRRIDGISMVIRQYKRGLLTKDETIQKVSEIAQALISGPDILLKFLRTERGFDIQLLLAIALAQLGQADEAIPFLLTLACNEEVYPWIRCNAASSLGELGKVAEATPVLLELARDEKVGLEVRREAASSLGELGRVDEAIPLLLEFAKDEEVEPEVRIDAASSLGKLGKAEEAILILLELAKDEKEGPFARCEAAFLLGELGKADKAIPTLLEVVRDRRMWRPWRRKAVFSLGKLGKEEKAATNALLEITRDKEVDPRLRIDAALVLGRLGRGKMVPVLLGFARAEEMGPWVRSRAYRALKELVGAGQRMG